MNQIEPDMIILFKGRSIDINKPVKVYRNLHKKGRVYSIKQENIVVAHATSICLKNVEFLINKSGKKKAIDTRVRNVHAFIKGFYFDHIKTEEFVSNTIKYDPFEERGFYQLDSGKIIEVNKASFCIADQNGVKTYN